LRQRRGLKNPWAGEEDVFFIHPQNGLNGLILKWCIGACWFTRTLGEAPNTISSAKPFHDIKVCGGRSNKFLRSSCSIENLITIMRV
jgi:hypothetical protein